MVRLAGKKKLLERLSTLAEERGRLAVRIDGGDFPAQSPAPGAPVDETAKLQRFRVLQQGAVLGLPERPGGLLVPVDDFHVLADWTSRPASSASAPWRTYSCSTRTGLPGAAGKVSWIRPRAWMDGLASKVIRRRERAVCDGR